MSSPDFAKLPHVLPQDVARTYPNGLPTADTLDWEQITRGWYEGAARNLDQRIITVTQTAGDNTAAINQILSLTVDPSTALAQLSTEVTTARGGTANLSARFSEVITAYTTADTTLASAITDVEARATGGSASAQMRIVAAAAPSGYLAQYDWQLRASGNPYPVGMTARVTSGGVGEIVFTASSFKLTDPSYAGGTPGNVFTYSSGAFVFNVPVSVRTGDLEANAATAHASNSGTINASTLSVTKTISAGSKVKLRIVLRKSDTTGLSPAATTFLTVIRSYAVQLDGTTFDYCYVPDAVTAVDLSGATEDFRTLPQGTTFTKVWDGTLSAGSHTFSVANVASYNMIADIEVEEFKR